MPVHEWPIEVATTAVTGGNPSPTISGEATATGKPHSAMPCKFVVNTRASKV